MRYHDVRPESPEKLTSAIEVNDIDAIREVLVSLAFHHDDWRWVQDRCLELTTHENEYVRKVSIICLGHIARIHRQLDLDRVIPKLHELELDPRMEGATESALSDISIFIHGIRASSDPDDSDGDD